MNGMREILFEYNLLWIISGFSMAYVEHNRILSKPFSSNIYNENDTRDYCTS